MKRFLSLFLTLFLIALSSGIRTPAMQQPGSISGTVTDKTGKALPGATVTISGPGITGSKTAITNADGTFRFSDLRPGTYKIKVQLEGFATTEHPSVVVGDKDTKLELGLSPDIDQKMLDMSGSPLIDVTGVGEVLEQIEGTPLIGATFKSNLPVDEVEFKLPGGQGLDFNASYLPEGWKGERYPEGMRLSGPPRLEIPARFKTRAWNQQLAEFFKKPVEFKFGLGKLNYGFYKFDFKEAEPAKPVPPSEAADIPETIRPGSSFQISPKVGYEKGTWKLSIGNDVFDAYEAKNPTAITSADVRYALEKALERKEIDGLFDQLGGTQPADPIAARVFHVPAGVRPPPGGKINLTYQNEHGETTVQGAANTTFLTGLTAAFALAPPRLFRCTPKILQNRSLCVCGFFPNAFSRGQLLLDGKRLEVPRAGSTDTVMFLPGNLAPGKHVISWDVPAFDNFFNPEPGRKKPSATEQVEFVVLVVDGSIDQDDLWAKQSTQMRMLIIGTNEKVPIELENTTPNVIELDKGDKQVAVTSGGSNNTLERKVTAKKTGVPKANFVINFKLALPSCPCNPAETEKAGQVGGNVSTPPDPPSGNQPTETRKDCELILAQYNARSIEYGRLQADVKRLLESCDRFDNGTTAGRDHRDYCRILTRAVNVQMLNRREELRKQMLDLLAAYRECIGGN